MYHTNLSHIPGPVFELIDDRLARICRLPDVTAVFLYGSYAKGTQTPESDVDIAVFFDRDATDFLEEYRALMKICANAHIEIQVQAFSDRELAQPCGIVEEIVSFGYPLYRAERAV